KLVDKGGYRPLQWRYRWDAKNHLTGLETPEGERWAYKYDPFGRRISKRCTNRDKPGMDFHWNGDQLAEEIPLHSDGTPDDENAIHWIYEPGSFTPLARYEKGQLHYAVTDTVGRIQELLTEEGTIVWKGKQQLWGKEESRSQEGAPSCRLRFPGQYEDDESGLFYNRYRYYDGDTGQYVSPDPIGLAGGVNPYGYVSNPLRWLDPLGLCKADVENKDLLHFDPKPPHIDPKNIGGKTPAEIDKIARESGLIPKGPHPMKGKGAYLDPVTSKQRVLIHPDSPTPHSHVNNSQGERLDINGNVVPPESPDAHLGLNLP
ncbi:RHS repeat domain-containing protein, partial [Hafnia alvei]